jgi:hypothetical protein
MVRLAVVSLVAVAWALGCGSRTTLSDADDGNGAAAGSGGFGGGFGGYGAYAGGGLGGYGASPGTGGFGGGWGGYGAYAGMGAVAGMGAWGGWGAMGGNIFDALPPLPDTSPVSHCVSCASLYCNSQVNACFADARCGQGLVCAALSCQAQDMGCLLGCFGDPNAMLTGVSALLCLGQYCGVDCVGALTGGAGTYGAAAAAPPDPSGATASYYDLGPDAAGRMGVPAGRLLLPPIEVLDSLPAMQGSCAQYGANCAP